jgi:putative glycosyltransferase (TIGR04372 family)
MQDARNCEIESYKLAINEINRRGGWVIRMGNEKLPNTNLGEKYIDYGSTDVKEDWMDMFICSEGKFFIGTNSGPAELPRCFGRPGVYTNWTPIVARPVSKGDILLPKRYWLKKESRFLTLEEMISDIYGFQESTQALKKIGITIVDNTPEELRDAVREMFHKKEVPRVLNKRRQEAFAQHSLERRLYPVKIADTYWN